MIRKNTLLQFALALLLLPFCSSATKIKVLFIGNSYTSVNTLPTLFTKANYTWMIIGGLVIATGFYLLSGGKSTDPAVFDTKEVYSTTRITIAPIVIILGFVIEIYAIFKKAK